jgi:hypothetical protein
MNVSTSSPPLKVVGMTLFVICVVAMLAAMPETNEVSNSELLLKFSSPEISEL